MMIPTRFSVNLATGLALAAGFVLPTTAGALEVHKWANAQGLVHYSESPPPDAADMASMETFEVNSDYASPDESRDRYRAMLEVAKELEASRLANERARAEQEAREFEQWRQLMAIPPAYAGETYPIAYPFTSGFFHNPFFPQFRFSSDRFGGPILNRGTFVPDVKFRPFQGFNPAARAGAMGGVAFPH